MGLPDEPGRPFKAGDRPIGEVGNPLEEGDMDVLAIWEGVAPPGFRGGLGVENRPSFWPMSGTSGVEATVDGVAR